MKARGKLAKLSTKDLLKIDSLNYIGLRVKCTLNICLWVSQVWTCLIVICKYESNIWRKVTESDLVLDTEGS